MLFRRYLLAKNYVEKTINKDGDIFHDVKHVGVFDKDLIESVITLPFFIYASLVFMIIAN